MDAVCNRMLGNVNQTAQEMSTLTMVAAEGKNASEAFSGKVFVQLGLHLNNALVDGLERKILDQVPKYPERSFNKTRPRDFQSGWSSSGRTDGRSPI